MPCPINIVLRPLEALMPLFVQSVAFSFKVVCNRQADVHRRRFQCLQHQARHLSIDRRGR
ncbi:hypothetical protein AQZ50_18765 [Novosphingobium sp. Fuku2-ISO-50]|nr:hypothetical protein AQZ50_18765 [Novosphingobium sp. Fuku2-ISO-50]